MFTNPYDLQLITLFAGPYQVTKHKKNIFLLSYIFLFNFFFIILNIFIQDWDEYYAMKTDMIMYNDEWICIMMNNKISLFMYDINI